MYIFWISTYKDGLTVCRTAVRSDTLLGCVWLYMNVRSGVGSLTFVCVVWVYLRDL